MDSLNDLIWNDEDISINPQGFPGDDMNPECMTTISCSPIITKPCVPASISIYTIKDC